MPTHFMPFVRVAFVLGLALVSMPLLRRAPATARRILLSATFVCVLVLPFVPAWHVDAPAVHQLMGSVVSEPAVAGAAADMLGNAKSSVSIDWLALVYVVGVLVVFARFAIGAVLARRMVGRAAPLEEGVDDRGLHAAERVGKPVEVRVSSEVGAPAVTGIFSPVVLVPLSSREWSASRWSSVLLHELAHVAAFDLAVQTLASIVCSLHWFNPLAWLALRRLRFERELAADEAVLQSGAKASAYAEDLLAVAGATRGGMIATAEHPLTKRIAAIVAAKQPSILGAPRAVALVTAAAGVAFGAACTTNVEAPAPRAATRVVESGLQTVAEHELDRTVKEWKASGGTILVLSPKGEVLADAGGRSNRPYVPGSTMKSVLLAAAFDEGLVKEDDVFDCRSGQRGDKTLQDAGEHGLLPLPEMLAVSSNIGFAQVFDRLGGARADRALRRFHFAPPAAFASQPSGDWDGALTAIGMRMTTTPLEVASAYAAIADGGAGIVKPSTAERVGRVLEGVVASENGTGKKARVDGVRVAGKTGSSTWPGKNGSDSTYASFVGFVPADHPRYVIFVGVEDAAGTPYGGAVAAPVFARIAAQALAR
jgi:beta-lactamase regulating signal transducer with metallopeptidase domain